MNSKEIFLKYATCSKGIFSTDSPLEEDLLMNFDGFTKALGEILSLSVEAQVSQENGGHLPSCICGSSAHWQKHNKRVGIFCDNCRMMTGYWNTVEDALKCWVESPHKRKPTNEEMDKLIELIKKR